MFVLLADAEIVRNWLTGTAIVVSMLTALAVLWLGSKARKSETMEARLHETTAKLIDERFRAMTHELNGHVNNFAVTLEEARQRLKNSEVDYRGLGERDQKIELTLAGKIDQLKDYIRDVAATKKDLDAHEATMEKKVERIEVNVSELSKEVAVLSDRVGMTGRA